MWKIEPNVTLFLQQTTVDKAILCVFPAKAGNTKNRMFYSFQYLFQHFSHSMFAPLICKGCKQMAYMKKLYIMKFKMIKYNNQF